MMIEIAALIEDGSLVQKTGNDFYINCPITEIPDELRDNGDIWREADGTLVISFEHGFGPDALNALFSDEDEDDFRVITEDE